MSASGRTILLASFPKSGRTWLRFLIAHYLNLHFEIGDTIDLRTVYRFVPSLAGGEETGIGAHLRYEGYFPLIMCTHAPYDDRFARQPTIFVKRDFGDMLVSYYHRVHNAQSAAHFEGTLSEFVVQFPWETAGTFFNTWADRIAAEPSVLVTSYEAMHADAGQVLTRALRVAGIEVVPAMVDRAVQSSTFEVMRATEDTQAEPGYAGQYDLAIQNARHVRAGKIGAGDLELSAADRQAIADRRAKHFGARAQALLAGLA